MGLQENHAVENALATIGAVLWSIQIIPQLVLSYRTKSTKGLSENLMLIWYFATLFLGAYLVAQRLSIPLQIQPQLFGMFSAVSYAQCLYYGRGFSRLKAGLVLLVLLAVFAGFEAGSVYALWAGQARGVEWPLLMYGYISAALLALGLAPQYWEIYKLRQVIGISLFFLSVDILGGVFSFLSLFFRSDLDIAAFVSYAGVVVLDSLVILLAFILNPIAKRRGYWIGDKPQPDALAAGAGEATPDVNQGSNTQLDVRPIRSRLSSSGACDRPQPLHPALSPESKGGRRAYLNTTDTQDTVVADEQQKREQSEEEARTEAESRGAGAHAAGAEGFEGIRRVEGRLGLT